MFIIRWTNKDDNEKFVKHTDIEKGVAKIGSDGAILKCIDTSKSNGVIIYYSEIIGYISYEAEPLDISNIKKLHFDIALSNMTKDELVMMIKEYNDYVQDNVSITDKQNIKVEDLLIWLPVCYLE